jgi:YesN/AraC family two-component response regulator
MNRILLKVTLKSSFLKLYIKNMVSLRCNTVVENELKKLGFDNVDVHLGEAEIKEEVSSEQYGQIRQALRQEGFDLLENKKQILVQQIKNAVIAIVHHSDEPLVYNLSVFLSKKLDYDYTYMSNLFSDHLGITIEKFYISHKIERVKELILYDELNLTEIALKMQYSSVGHLSSQFKKVTGLTPSDFRRDKNRPR